MVRVGFVRWFINCGMIPQNCGKTAIRLSLTPQASTYHTLLKVWHGIHSESVERDILVEPHTVQVIDETYNLRANAILRHLQTLAAELSERVVNYCVNLGIVDYAEYDKSAAMYIVRQSLINAAKDNRNDNDLRVDRIDLVPDMRACIEEKARQHEERARIAAEAWAAHQAEVQERRAANDVEYAKALNTSFELLYSMLSPAEIEEVKTKHCLMVHNLLGDFKVPAFQHGLVEHFVEGKYKASYCVVFEDYRLPLGDEILMKVVLLKTNPDKFLKVANKFVTRRNGLFV